MTPARVAYQKTQDYLQEMHKADQLDDLAHAWELFLIFHQRTWNKCEQLYKTNDFWGRLWPRYSTRRKTDSVLLYVSQARHADEHGIKPIAQVHPGKTVISSGTLTSGTRIIGGGEYVLGHGSSAIVKVIPANVLSNNVENRGRTYPPPVLNGIATPPVLLIANEAIKFLDDLFVEIDKAGGD